MDFKVLIEKSLCTTQRKREQMTYQDDTLPFELSLGILKIPNYHAILKYQIMKRNTLKYEHLHPCYPNTHNLQISKFMLGRHIKCLTIYQIETFVAKS